MQTIHHDTPGQATFCGAINGMEPLQVIETLLSLSADREALIASLIHKTLLTATPSDETLEPVSPMPTTVVTESDTKLQTPFDSADLFPVGARFRKRKAMNGRSHVVVAVIKAEGINVWFDRDFRTKAWSGSCRKKTIDSVAARKFLAEFERI